MFLGLAAAIVSAQTTAPLSLTVPPKVIARAFIANLASSVPVPM